MAVTLNLEHSGLTLERLKELQPRVTKIHEAMHAKTSRGSHYLGWLDLPKHINKDELQSMRNLKETYKDLDCLIVIGIGGSYLGAKAGLEFVKESFSSSKPEIIFAGHHLSSGYLKSLLKYLEGRNYAINVISKSGTTTEPAIAFRFLKQAIETKYGKKEASKRIFATTDGARGSLYQLAKQEKYEMFLIPDDVGGRYSVLTAVGLLPFVFGGLDVDALINGAQEAYNDLLKPEIKENNAYLYAAARYHLYQNGKAIEMLANYEPNLIFFSEWWKQLFGESEGKENKGLFVASAAFTTDLHSLGQYIQQGVRHLFETVIEVNHTVKLLIPEDKENLDKLNYIAGKEVSYVNQQALLGAMQAHEDGGVPNLHLKIDSLDAYHFGYLVYFFEKACAMSAYLLEVNPFDQPGVEDYKTNMFKLLGK